MKKQYHIAFYKANSKSNISRAIAFWKKAQVTHAEFVLEIHKGKSECFSSYEGEGVRFKSIDLHNEKWEIVKLPFLLDDKKLKNFMTKHNTEKYDWLGILTSQFFGSMRHNSGKWFCSEICGAMCGLTSPQRYDPQALKDILEDMERIKTDMKTTKGKL